MTWIELNEKLRTATEAECARLMQEEKKGRRRILFMLRIHGRLSKLRNQREREELLARKTMKRDYEKGNWDNR